MLIDGKPSRTIQEIDNYKLSIIDQTLLPHKLEYIALATLEDAFNAIKNMHVRGAPLIGITAAYGMALAIRDDPSKQNINEAEKKLLNSRPTAVDLKWAVNRIKEKVINLNNNERFEAAWLLSGKLAEDSVFECSTIGDIGRDLILKEFKNRKNINILTHCNAGWLACVDWGTALSPIYKLFNEGVDIHVWVDETRPRSQGALLTTWELTKHGVSNTLIVDNAGGHLMQEGKIDMCLVGSDRTTANGDVCNKIGTYLKALSAYDNNLPFYVALPESTIDFSLRSGVNNIPIEVRSSKEVSHVIGIDSKGSNAEIRISGEHTNIYNPGFDVTPNKYVTKLITNKGVCEASKEGIDKLFK
ncbi:MAG: Methylthioribose-1-phosphate isomerase [Alphaproteobacteria bacterium MarineAlpha9_Bin2]|nr:MAG: Methylthioribose-1-phosphate isomerase [Alphaproteobacteria bacterium MarineAlpha9_Bin2]